MENQKYETVKDLYITENLETSGITLIALVVTIVVLLILAGVSISVLSGQNGILNRAGEAKESTEETGLQEEINLKVMEKTTDSYAGGTQSLGYYLEQIGGATVTKLAEGAWLVIRDNVELTVYDDGTVETGKYDIWDGTSIECPVIEEDENGVFNWYIYTAAQLKFLADFTNNGRQLTGDAGDLTSLVTEDVKMTEYTVVYLMNNIDLGARQTNGEWTTDTEWTPIGKTNTNKLVATFEGNGNTIRGVYINTDTKYNGIFGNSNTIQNLTVKDSYIAGANCTAGIVGALRSGNIENCHNVDTTVVLIEGEYTSVGGICGQFTGTEISNCSNSGSIIAYGMSSGLSQMGGIVGRLSGSSTISGCTNSGAVTGEGDYAGGVVGYANTSSTIESCSNSGSVTGKGDYTGGVVGGANTSSTIERCSNSGSITGEGSGTGGVVGYAYTSSTIESCSNSGSITGEGSGTGGVVGYAYTSSTIENCSNSGSVTGKAQATGGIAGAAAYIVTECSNTGNITGITAVGGITGDCVTGYQQQISKCYNSGTVTGTNYIGGISGRFGDTGATMTQCYNKGTVTGSTEVGTIIGYTDYDSEVTKCYYYTADETLVGVGALEDGGTVTLEKLREGTTLTNQNNSSYEEFIEWIKSLE